MESATWLFGNRVFSIKDSDKGVPGLEGLPLDMSSLSRRACYKCGNVGHYAGRCQLNHQNCGAANNTQRYARLRNVYATIVSQQCTSIARSLDQTWYLACANILIGKQPGKYTFCSCAREVHHPHMYLTTLQDTNRMAAPILAPPTVRALENLHQICEEKANIRIAKQCYHCQGLGHVQADCPTLRISGAGTGGGRCYSCGQPGHLAVCASCIPLESDASSLVT